jgi:hypothetical protein
MGGVMADFIVSALRFNDFIGVCISFRGRRFGTRIPHAPTDADLIAAACNLRERITRYAHG